MEEQKNRKIIYLAGFLFSLPLAFMLYINSSFLSTFMSEKVVGLAYALGSLGSITGLLLAPKIFRRIGGYKFLLSVILLDALSILLFSFSKNTLSALLVFIVGLTLNTLIIFSLDEILKIFSNTSVTGRVRGIYLSTCHLSFITAQICFALFFGLFSYSQIYLFAFGLMLVFFLLAFFKLKNIPDPDYDKVKSFKYVNAFFKNKNLFRAYSLTFLLQFFYCWMVIYTPIYLYSHLGFSWSEIGTIFAFMLLPFLVVPFNVGKYADKIGERSLLMLGFTIISVAVTSLFLIHTHSVLIWASLLFATRLGASIVETMSDSYFFKHIKSRNEEFVGVYRSGDPVAYILGPIIASVFFLFVPAFNYIYIILGAIMLGGVYLASTIKKSDI